jgi:hypothetical protein
MSNEMSNEVFEKQEWVRPALQRLDAGSAESDEGGTPDGSGPQAS